MNNHPVSRPAVKLILMGAVIFILSFFFYAQPAFADNFDLPFEDQGAEYDGSKEGTGGEVPPEEVGEGIPINEQPAGGEAAGGDGAAGEQAAHIPEEGAEEETEEIGEGEGEGEPVVGETAGGEEAVNSIQEKLNAASRNEEGNRTVLIDGGFYYEDLVIDTTPEFDYSGLELIASGIGGVPTIAGNVFFHGITGFLLQGFEITGLITVQDSEEITITGTAGDDLLRILLQGTVNNICIGGDDGNDTINLSGSAGEGYAAVAGGGGDDHLVVDFGEGNPIPSGGLSYDGGEDYDILSFRDGSFNTVHYRAIDEHSGTIQFDQSLVSYRNIEPIHDFTEAEEALFKGTDSDNIITIIYAGLVTDPGSDPDNPVACEAIEIQCEDFENIFFANKAQVIVDGIGGNDTIKVMP